MAWWLLAISVSQADEPVDAEPVVEASDVEERTPPDALDTSAPAAPEVESAPPEVTEVEEPAVPPSPASDEPTPPIPAAPPSPSAPDTGETATVPKPPPPKERAERPVAPPVPQPPPWSLRAPEPSPPEDDAVTSMVERLATQLVPTLGRRGPQALFGLALIALISLAAAGAARTFRARLRPTGVLPSIMVAIEIFGRAVAVVVALTAIVALLPVGILPALTWIAIGAAVAVGWSLREVLPDVFAWVVLTTEGQLVRGVWVRTGEHQGAIEAFTLRAISLIDASGQRISIPNRMLLQQPIQATTDTWPRVHVTVRLAEVEAADARRMLWEASLLSPWLAPSTTPEIGQDPSDPAQWHVSVRLLEGGYEDEFAGSFPERVSEVRAATLDAS